MKVNILILYLFLLSITGCIITKPLKLDQCNTDNINIKSVFNEGNNSILKGKVIDEATGENLPNSTVILTKEKVAFLGTRTDSNGEFAINNVPNGNYELSVSSTNHYNVEATIKIDKPTVFSLDVKLYKYSTKIAKPVIYLYPLQKQDIVVELKYNGVLTHSYPRYPQSGWKVTADPNGTLHDENGQEYYALFWEGISRKEFKPQNGFVISGKETAVFLEEKLAYLGLNRREANEFIMYWLPLLENNSYNLIHFSSNEYESDAALRITPQPETIIRFSMITQPLQSKINFPIQDLSTMQKSRKGFTVVEWGGCIINNATQISN